MGTTGGVTGGAPVTGPPDAGRAGRWTLVLPVQRPDRAKSRLHVPDGVGRRDLARAIAADSLAAVRETAAVGHRVVVTGDVELADLCRAEGDTVVPDDGTSLTAAVAAGVRAALERDPGAPLGVLLPDVPALRPEQLAAALEAAAAHPFAVVPDAEGTGSVLLTAVPGRLLRPAFGVGSARRHADLGATVLALDLAALRRDVDTLEALRAAAALGLGPATRAVLADRLAGPLTASDGCAPVLPGH